MKIDAAFLPAEVRGQVLTDMTCIVLDIFRATTSIVTAMTNGCTAIMPVVSIEAARKLAATMQEPLLAGERRSIKIEGFDLGNSPFDFSAEAVKQRSVVMTTSNGTIAIHATEGAAHTLIGSFINAQAVCQTALSFGKDILIVCAGTEGAFSLEDALCAGFLTKKFLEANAGAVLSDSARGALLMYERAQYELVAVAKNSKNGKRLCELGRVDDIERCFSIDLTQVVPNYKNGRITV